MLSRLMPRFAAVRLHHKERRTSHVPPAGCRFGSPPQHSRRWWVKKVRFLTRVRRTASRIPATGVSSAEVDRRAKSARPVSGYGPLNTERARFSACSMACRSSRSLPVTSRRTCLAVSPFWPANQPAFRISATLWEELSVLVRSSRAVTTAPGKSLPSVK